MHSTAHIFDSDQATGSAPAGCARGLTRWSAGAAAALALFVLLAHPASTLAAAPTLSDTRSTLEKWVETRQVTARTRADWIAEKETLTNTLSLFVKELSDLQERVSGVTTNRTAVQEETSAMQAEKAALSDALAKGAEAATALEARLRTLAPQFPPPLMANVEQSLQKFPEDPANTRMDAVTRLRIILGVINEVDKFNTSVNLGTEVQKQANGTEVQVQTLYLGLGQAYFVHPDGTAAGVGVPAAEGWQWTPRNELAPVILQAIGIYENALPAGFVGLPVQIK